MTSRQRALEALLSQLDAMRAQVSAMLEGLHDESQVRAPAYLDARSAEQLGLKRRAFLHYARAGAFPSFLRGNKRVAKREDLVAWIESRSTQPPAPVEDTRDDVDAKIAALLERGRLRPVAGGRSR